MPKLISARCRSAGVREWSPHCLMVRTPDQVFLINFRGKLLQTYSLPEELRQYRSSCFALFYHNVKTYAEQSFKLNDHETYNYILNTLEIHGFRD